MNAQTYMKIWKEERDDLRCLRVTDSGWPKNKRRITSLLTECWRRMVGRRNTKMKCANDSMSSTILAPNVILKLMTFPCRPQWRMNNRITDNKIRVFLNARDSSLLFSSSSKSLGEELSYTETMELLLFSFPFLNTLFFKP